MLLCASALAALALFAAGCTSPPEPADGGHDGGLDGHLDGDLDGDAGPDADLEPDPNTLRATATAESSSRLALEWESVPGSSGVRVTLSAEPGEDPTAPLPEAVEVAALSGEATSFTLTGLAPAVDVFVRVEVEGALPLRFANLHARMPGGPRADLDTPVREVHGYGPAILLLVMANPGTTFAGEGHAGDTGPEWQAGPWTVARRDGSSIGVEAVHRRTIPVGQPSYELGYGGPWDDSVVDMDHWIFLALDQPVGGREILRVEGPAGLSLTVPWSDRYLESPVIQLNQVGYSPRARQRYAYVSGHLGDGGSLPLGSFPATAEVLAENPAPTRPRASVLSGLPVTVRSESDSDSGGEVRQVDLSALAAAEGQRLRVRLPGVGVSWPTQVSERAVLKAFYVIARGLYHNRWGRDLRPEHTNWAPRPPDHPVVYVTEHDLMTGGEFINLAGVEGWEPADFEARALAGGHHDAGDFDIRVGHTLVDMLLLRAVELSAAALIDGQLTIPESGNGVPDLLDEALWGLRAWETLQEADGGVRPGVESWRHPFGFYYADQDPLPYYAYAREPNTTARAAGLFAQASRLLRPFDSRRADDLEDRARRAFGYASSHGADEGPLFYAAGELLRLTGERAFAEAFDAAWVSWGSAFHYYASGLPWFGSLFERDQPATADYLVAYAASDGATPAIAESIRAQLATYADEVVARFESEHAHRNGRPRSQPPDWGYGTAVGEYLSPVYARLQLGGLRAEERQAYLDAVSLSADYVLGANPLGLAWVTGLGSRHPEEPLHLDSLAFVRDGREPIPGIPVYGFVREMPDLPYYRPTNLAFYPALAAMPLGYRYADARASVNGAEFDVSIQAKDAALLAVLLGAPLAPPASWLPGAEEHESTLP